MFQTIKEFFQENGKGSSKRWIAISIAGVLAWGLIFALVKANTDNARQALINSTMIFILVMSGVATVSQVVSLVRGGPQTKEDKPEEPKTP